MQLKINLTHVICLRIGKTTKTKPHRINLMSSLPRIHYYQNKRLQVKGILVPNTNLQLNLYLNTQLGLEDVPLNESNLKKFTKIGTSMGEKTKQEYVGFLKKSIDFLLGAMKTCLELTQV